MTMVSMELTILVSSSSLVPTTFSITPSIGTEGCATQKHHRSSYRYLVQFCLPPAMMAKKQQTTMLYRLRQSLLGQVSRQIVCSARQLTIITNQFFQQWSSNGLTKTPTCDLSGRKLRLAAHPETRSTLTMTLQK